MSSLHPSPSPRLASLDFFRGATVAAMILVNNPGTWAHIYWPLEHADWHGCTPTDLIMPFFLFIVGISIVYALDTRKQQPSAHGTLLWHAAKRAAILIALGLVLAFFPGSPAALQQLLHDPLARLAELRLPGVLQRIGIVYFCCAALFIKTTPRIWAAATILILLAYHAALTLIPVPAKDGFLSPNLAPDTNLAAWFDRLILTPAHLYKHGQYDPEGVLSTLAAIPSGLIGMVAGHYLKRGPVPTKNNPNTNNPATTEPELSATAASIATAFAATTRVAWLYCAGVLVLALAWCWTLAIPLNKQLSTPSYTLHTAGLALLALATSYWLLDVHRYRRGTTPFIAFGVNAITAFFASGLMVRALNLLPLNLADKPLGLKDYAYQRFLAPLFTTPELASLTAALLFLALWTAIVLVMHHRRWIIKV